MSSQAPLSKFPSTEPLTLLLGYQSPVVFAAFRVELSSVLKSGAQIKSVLLFVISVRCKIFLLHLAIGFLLSLVTK